MNSLFFHAQNRNKKKQGEYGVTELHFYSEYTPYSIWGLQYKTRENDYVKVDFGDGYIYEGSPTNMPDQYEFNSNEAIVKIEAQVLDLDFYKTNGLNGIITNPNTLYTNFTLDSDNLEYVICKDGAPNLESLKYINIYSHSRKVNLPDNVLHRANNAEYLYLSNICDFEKDLLIECKKLIRFQCFFATKIPYGFFRNNQQLEGFSFCFSDELIEIPNDIADYSPLILDFHSAFYECPNITSEVPRLWERPNSIGHSCFYNCTKAANYSEIPASWK